MKKLIITLFIVFTVSSIIFAAGKAIPENEGVITPEMLAEIRNSFVWDGQSKAVYNALLENNLSDLAKNSRTAKKLDKFFSLELETKGITDQKSSGRCWLFATFNVFRQNVIKKYNLDGFEFSQNYAMFWDKFEKANLFMEYVIMNPNIDWNDQEFILLLKTPLPDGGFWSMSANVIMKYGVVPQSVMPESNSSSNTGKMNDLMEQKMRQFAYELREMAKAGKKVKALREAKVEMLKEIYRMLVLNLGMPPSTFEWRYTDKDGKISETKTYTPKSFYDEFIGVDLNEYVVLGNCPSQPYGKNYRIKLGRGQIEGTDWTFLNMEMSVLKEAALKCLQDSTLLEFSVDMTGKQRNSKTGFMAMELYDYESVYGVKFPLNKTQMVLTRDSAPNHAMVLTGVDLKEGKPLKWKIENSWGSDAGDDGFFIMTDEWFDNWGYSVVVNKKYLPPEVVELTKTEPVMLPFWDPLAKAVSVEGY